MSAIQLNVDDLVRKALKYALEGVAVAIAAKLLPDNNLSLTQLIVIAFTTALVFAIIDGMAADVAFGVRTGAGLAIG